MFSRLGGFVARRSWWVIIAWGAAVAALWWVAPRWEDVTHDGDLAYLPADRPSVLGERLLAAAFPVDLAKSQIVTVLARRDGPLKGEDVFIGYDVARRMRNLQAAAGLGRVRRLRAVAPASGSPDKRAHDQRVQRILDDALEAARDAVDLDGELISYYADKPEARLPPRLASAYWNLAHLSRAAGDEQGAEEAREIALELDPKLAEFQSRPAPSDAEDLPLLDVWTWDSEFGKRLISGDQQARLVVLQLSNEFLATDNIRVLTIVEREVAAVREWMASRQLQELELGISGSAAVGGDLMRSSLAMIRHTEAFTIVLVVLILGVVYRAPLLVLAPLLTIGLSLLASTSAVAMLTQVGQLPGMHWWDLKVFTTTRIFIVVILFGAGTDYCLFLIARFKEELRTAATHDEAIERALAGVGDALAASALTTIVGLATMAFADFGKYRYSGPVIGFCLIITLLTCVTFTPALLRVFGRAVFWPFSSAGEPTATRWTEGWWSHAAGWIVRYPGRVLVVTMALMTPFAVYGIGAGGEVTYDILNALSPRCESRRGAALMRRHFAVGESGPITVLAYREDGGLTTDAGKDAIRELTQQLYMQDAGAGVLSVRSIADPLGEFQPGSATGPSDSRFWRTMISRPHRRTAEIFLAQAPRLVGKVTRLDVIIQDDPFTLEAIDTLSRIHQRLRELSDNPASYWHGADFHFTGTTSGIRDLRAVTRSDTLRIEVLVVLAVLAVLLVILKRPLICLYMILTVLFSYYVAIGGAALIFHALYGDSYQGLDWKVPLYLFVILVAIGQDYNVYLATRVFEEQDRLGPLEGLRTAIVRTGGIITSCGVIMAGTFLSMTGSAIAEGLGWTSETGALRGIVELGVALALGVLLDTFIVRPCLVPAFLALLARRGSTENARSRSAPTEVPAATSVRMEKPAEKPEVGAGS